MEYIYIVELKMTDHSEDPDIQHRVAIAACDNWHSALKQGRAMLSHSASIEMDNDFEFRKQFTEDNWYIYARNIPQDDESEYEWSLGFMRIPTNDWGEM